MISTSSHALSQVTMIVPWESGDSADHVMTAILPHMGIEVDVMYMAGDSGSDGLERVFNTPEDVVGVGAGKALTTRWINGEWDLTIDDWEVFPFWVVTPVFSVRADLGITTMDEALRWMREGSPTVATTGKSSVSQDAIEALLNADRSLSVNYHTEDRGAQAAIQSVLAGKADISVQTYNEQIEYFESGEMIPLAVFSGKTEYANEKAIRPVQDYIEEPLPILNSTYGVLVPKHKTELVSLFTKAWKSLPINVHTEGTIYAPLYGKRARWLLNKEISIAAWSIARQGKAERSPIALGLPTPEIKNYKN